MAATCIKAQRYIERFWHRQTRVFRALQGNRQFFARTLFRVATPFREVTWADFLLADILTSLAKALSDLERAMCHMLAGPVMKPHASEQVQNLLFWASHCTQSQDPPTVLL